MTETFDQVDNCIVEYTDFDPLKMIGLTPEEKAIPTSNVPGGTSQISVPQKYMIVPINYNYGTDEKPRLDNLYLQLPAMKCFGGITAKPNQQGRLEYGLYCPLPQSDPSLKKCVEILHNVYMASARIIGQHKQALKMVHFDDKNPQVSGYDNKLVFRSKDKLTNEPIEGKTPSLYPKLVNRSSGKYVDQTIFTGMDGKPLDWKLLYNVDMVLIPLYHVDRIYRGGNTTSLQVKMISAVVLSIEKKGSTSLQMNTINRYVNSNPLILDKFKSQLEVLTYENQDQLLSSNTDQTATKLVQLEKTNSPYQNESESSEDCNNFESSKPTMHRLNLQHQNSQSSLPQTQQMPSFATTPSLPAMPSMPSMPSMIPNVNLPVRPSLRTLS